MRRRLGFGVGMKAKFSYIIIAIILFTTCSTQTYAGDVDEFLVVPGQCKPLPLLGRGGITDVFGPTTSGTVIRVAQRPQPGQRSFWANESLIESDMQWHRSIEELGGPKVTGMRGLTAGDHIFYNDIRVPALEVEFIAGKNLAEAAPDSRIGPAVTELKNKLISRGRYLVDVRPENIMWNQKTGKLTPIDMALDPGPGDYSQLDRIINNMNEKSRAVAGCSKASVSPRNFGSNFRPELLSKANRAQFKAGIGMGALNGAMKDAGVDPRLALAGGLATSAYINYRQKVPGSFRSLGGGVVGALGSQAVVSYAGGSAEQQEAAAAFGGFAGGFAGGAPAGVANGVAQVGSLVGEFGYVTVKGTYQHGGEYWSNYWATGYCRSVSKCYSGR